MSAWGNGIDIPASSNAFLCRGSLVAKRLPANPPGVVGVDVFDHAAGDQAVRDDQLAVVGGHQLEGDPSDVHPVVPVAGGPPLVRSAPSREKGGKCGAPSQHRSASRRPSKQSPHAAVTTLYFDGLLRTSRRGRQAGPASACRSEAPPKFLESFYGFCVFLRARPDPHHQTISETAATRCALSRGLHPVFALHT